MIYFLLFTDISSIWELGLFLFIIQLILSHIFLVLLELDNTVL